jgi:hypothetical protein
LGNSNEEFPFSEQLEFDLDEQDIEQFKVKDSYLEEGWTKGKKDPQNKQERKKLDNKF